MLTRTHLYAFGRLSPFNPRVVDGLTTQVDECLEDTDPPLIITSEYSFPRCFNNLVSAAAFFATNTEVRRFVNP